MKPNLEFSYLLSAQLLMLPEQDQQPAALSRFSPDDVVLMHSVRDEEQWMVVAQACMQPGTRLLVYPSEKSAEQLARHIREEKVTVLITTARQWLAIYQQLNQAAKTTTQLNVVLVDTAKKPEKRCAWLPAALSRAKIENTYEAYRKAPWIQKTSK